jgi:lycopene cyclase domain-containing protein
VKATYLLVLLACLVGTAPLSLFLQVRVFSRWRRVVCSVLCVLVPFVAWDVWAISRHQWAYDPRQVIGWQLWGHLPVEELLFFVVIPLCAILTYEAVRARRPSWTYGDEPS